MENSLWKASKGWKWLISLPQAKIFGKSKAKLGPQASFWANNYDSQEVGPFIRRGGPPLGPSATGVVGVILVPGRSLGFGFSEGGNPPLTPLDAHLWWVLNDFLLLFTTVQGCKTLFGFVHHSKRVRNRNCILEFCKCIVRFGNCKKMFATVNCATVFFMPPCFCFQPNQKSDSEVLTNNITQPWLERIKDRFRDLLWFFQTDVVFSTLLSPTKRNFVDTKRIFRGPQ